MTRREQLREIRARQERAVPVTISGPPNLVAAFEQKDADIAWLLAEVARLQEWGDGWQRGFLAYERKVGSILTREDLDA